MNNEAWTMVALFLGLVGTVSGFVSLVMKGAETRPKDPDSTKGKSWYDGYDKGVEATRKINEASPTGLAKARAAGYEVGYKAGSEDAQNIKGSFDDAYSKGYAQGVISGKSLLDGIAFQNGYDKGKIDGNNQGYANAKRFYEKPNVAPSRSDAYLDGIKTMADAMEAALPKDPDAVKDQAEKHLQRLGYRLITWTVQQWKS